MNNDKLQQLKENIIIQLGRVDDNLEKVNEIKVQLLGKKGLINQHMADLKNLSGEEKKEKAQILNQVKQEITKLINDKTTQITQKLEKERLLSERIDVTADFDQFNEGNLHVNEIVADFMKEIFVNLGFEISNAPLIDSDKNNFEDLNIAKDHPAREMQDTFYLDPHTLLRTHATNTTSQDLKRHNGEFKSVAIGKVFRRDSDDATHSHQFMQIDGVCVSKDASLAQLIGTLTYVVKKVFGETLDTRIRPSYFPFTEPSLEIDVECSNCNKKGCSKCKQSGWVEILGCGMLHPNVLTNCGYDASEYKGFAFGIGLERIAILSYNIKDIRNMYTNDLRFNKQFSTFKGGK